MINKTEKKFLDELDIDIKKFGKHLIIFVLLLIVFNFFSSFFHNKQVILFEQTYNLEIIFIIIFVVVFFPLLSSVLKDTKDLFNLISEYVVRKFPGMQEEVKPIIRIFRNLVYIIIIFLVSVGVIPLFSKYQFTLFNLTKMISIIFLIFFIFFFYDILKQIQGITKGHFNKLGEKGLALLKKLDRVKKK